MGTESTTQKASEITSTAEQPVLSEIGGPTSTGAGPGLPRVSGTGQLKLTPQNVRQLQPIIGNQAVMRLIASQKKTAVTPPSTDARTIQRKVQVNLNKFENATSFVSQILNSTFVQIQSQYKAYLATNDPAKESLLLANINTLCNTWMTRHAALQGRKDPQKLELIVQLKLAIANELANQKEAAGNQAGNPAPLGPVGAGIDTTNVGQEVSNATAEVNQGNNTNPTSETPATGDLSTPATSETPDIANPDANHNAPVSNPYAMNLTGVDPGNDAKAEPDSNTNSNTANPVTHDFNPYAMSMAGVDLGNNSNAPSPGFNPFGANFAGIDFDTDYHHPTNSNQKQEQDSPYHSNFAGLLNEDTPKQNERSQPETQNERNHVDNENSNPASATGGAKSAFDTTVPFANPYAQDYGGFHHNTPYNVPFANPYASNFGGYHQNFYNNSDFAGPGNMGMAESYQHMETITNHPNPETITNYPNPETITNFSNPETTNTWGDYQATNNSSGSERTNPDESSGSERTNPDEFDTNFSEKGNGFSPDQNSSNSPGSNNFGADPYQGSLNNGSDTNHYPEGRPGMALKLSNKIGFPVSFLNSLSDEQLEMLGQIDSYFEEGDVGGADKLLASLRNQLGEVVNMIKSMFLRQHMGKVNKQLSFIINNPGFKATPAQTESAQNQVIDLAAQFAPKAKEEKHRVRYADMGRTVLGMQLHGKLYADAEDLDPNNRHINQKMAMEASFKSFSNLTRPEATTLVGYASDLYQNFNNPLRAGFGGSNASQNGNSSGSASQSGGFGRKNLDMTASLVSALNKMPKYRGVVFRHTGIYPGYLEMNAEGATVSDLAFMSTAMDITGTGGGRNHQVLEIILNTKTGRIIEGGAFFTGEREVLFKPGTRFKVLARVDKQDFSNGNGNWLDQGEIANLSLNNHQQLALSYLGFEKDLNQVLHVVVKEEVDSSDDAGGNQNSNSGGAGVKQDPGKSGAGAFQSAPINFGEKSNFANNSTYPNPDAMNMAGSYQDTDNSSGSERSPADDSSGSERSPSDDSTNFSNPDAMNMGGNYQNMETITNYPNPETITNFSNPDAMNMGGSYQDTDNSGGSERSPGDSTGSERTNPDELY